MCKKKNKNLNLKVKKMENCKFLCPKKKKKKWDIVILDVPKKWDILNLYVPKNRTY